MPYFRINGMVVHLKLGGPKAKRPHPCCARIPCASMPGTVYCLAIATRQCDWPLEDGGTCDAHLCSDHAAEVGPDLHYCPIHVKRQQPEGAT